AGSPKKRARRTKESLGPEGDTAFNCGEPSVEEECESLDGYLSIVMFLAMSNEDGVRKPAIVMSGISLRRRESDRLCCSLCRLNPAIRTGSADALNLPAARIPLQTPAGWQIIRTDPPFYRAVRCESAREKPYGSAALRTQP